MKMNDLPTQQWALARRAEKMNPSVIREILKVTERPGIISLAGGLPSPEDLSGRPIRRRLRQGAARRRPARRCSTPPAKATAPLREMGRGACCPGQVDPAQVLITTGSQQGLDLVAKVLIDAGQPRAGGDAHLPGRAAGLHADGAGRGERGQRRRRRGLIDDAGTPSEAAGAHARFLYVLPNFQNPTGRTHERGAPRRPVAPRGRLGLPIVEDNPYGDLWFDQPPPPPLTARNPEGCIYLGSFSKVLAPGLRLGFLVAPKALYPKLLQAKQAADLHSPGFNQRMVAEVMKDGFLDRHVPTIRALYKAQRDAMLAALQREMQRPGRASGTRPTAACSCGCACPQGMNAVELLPKAVDKGVAFVPGAAFYADHADPRTLRLSFVTASVEQIDTGIAALAAAIREQLAAS